MKGIKIHIILLCITCASMNSLAQVPASWRIGKYGGLSFGSPTTPFLYLDTINNLGSISTIWNQNGSMLFFSNGIKVLDSMFNELPNSPLFSTLPISTQELGSLVYNSSIILPRPGYNDQYYIFHENSVYNSPAFENVTLYYSLIDKTLNGGYGDITNVKNVPLDDSLWFGSLAAIKHGNGRDWWIISGQYKTQILKVWLIQPDTIMGPFLQNIGLSWTNGAVGIWQSSFSEVGDRSAITYQDMDNNERRLLLSKFDRCNGLFYDTIHIRISNFDSMYTYSGLYGCSFSPSGRYLYTSSATYLYQFDIYAANIPASMIEVGVHDHAQVPFPSGFNFQKLAPDGRIYIATGNGNYVAGAIHYPDSAGLACQVELRYLDYFTQFGVLGIGIGVFPNYPNYNLGPLIGSGCDTLTSLNTTEGDVVKILNIYPNPTSGSFTLTYKLPQKAMGQVEIFNAVGNRVYSSSVSQWSSVHNVNLDEAISDGLYFCRVSSGSWSEWAKVVVCKN